MPTAHATKCPAQVKMKAEWLNHAWNPESVKCVICPPKFPVRLLTFDRNMLLAREGKIIELRASLNPESEPLKVHAELLCHFSTYYRAALKGGFLEKNSPSLEVAASSGLLHTVVSWMYTGCLSLEVGAAFSRQMIDIYYFADRCEMQALRRKVISDWSKKLQSGPPRLPSYANVSHAYGCLPANSSLLRFLESIYVWHWSWVQDDNAKARDGRMNAPKEFLSAILNGRDYSRDFINLPEESACCSCCYFPCRFHEHGSEEEWKASK